MNIMIIDYIKTKYAPLSIIVYGSYADSTNNENSDFDALVISESYEVYHDTAFVDGVQLDVFVYPVSYFAADCDPEEFVQIYDGKIIFDTSDIVQSLKSRVRSYVEERAIKNDEEINGLLDWLEEMRLRAKRNDAEGMFRRHWLLTDSLEIFCNVVKYPYFGPKKTLGWMKTAYPKEYRLYEKALNEFSDDSIDEWLLHLKNIK